MQQTSTPLPIALLSVVVPVHNEAGNITPLLQEIETALLPLLPFEVIVVNDSSQDATAEELKAAQATRAYLRVIHHQKSCGQSTALRTGVQRARGDWVATLDGDGQNDPADLPKLIHAITAGVQLVGGNRRHARRDPWIKRISSVVANTVRSRLLHDETPDTGCGLKLFQRAAFLDLPYFDHMHRFLPALIQRRGGRVVSVPVNHRPRGHGQSNYGTLDRLLVGVVDLIGMLWLIRRAKRPVIVEADE